MHASASYHGALSTLLDALQPPAPLAPHARAIREQLAQRPRGELPHAAVHDMAELIVRVRCRAEEERQSWDGLLEQLGEQLGSLYEQVQGTLQRFGAAHETERSIEQTLERQVDELRWRLSSAGDAGQMRAILRDQMGLMRNRLDDRKGKETLHYALFQRQLNVLAEALREMKTDLGRLRRRVAQEQVQALRDPVSGVANRLAYEQRFGQEFARWKRYGSKLALLVLEVDDLDGLAAAWGRRAAERALAVVAGILRAHLREADFIARYADATFAVLMPETRLEDVPAAAARLHALIASRSFHYRGEPVSVSVSVGGAALQPGDDPGAVLERARRALALERPPAWA